MLGTALFIRTKRSVALTPAGQALLPEAKRLLQQAASLPDLARRAASGASGLLSLAFISTADYSILPPLLQRFRARYPQVQIDLREATTDVQLEDLMQGKIDAGLLLPPLSDKASAVLDYLPVLSEPLVAALPAGLIRSKQAIQMQTIVGLVSAGMGMALVPQSVSNLQRPGVDYRALSGKSPLIETGLAWRRDNPSAVLRAFLDMTALPGATPDR